MRRLHWAACRLLKVEASLLGRTAVAEPAGGLLQAAAFSASARGAADSLFCTNVSGLKGNSPILIGLMEYFSRHMPKVGFYQPIGADPLAHHHNLPKHVAM